MATRAERLSRDHVQALNLIDIEFYGRLYFGVRLQSKPEKAVTNAWKNYNDHLNDRSYKSTEEWFKHGTTLITKMLYEMSQALGYDFDEIQLKRDAYRPDGHVNIENAQLGALQGLAMALSGKGSLSVVIGEPAEAAKVEGPQRDAAVIDLGEPARAEGACCARSRGSDAMQMPKYNGLLVKV